MQRSGEGALDKDFLFKLFVLSACLAVTLRNKPQRPQRTQRKVRELSDKFFLFRTFAFFACLAVILRKGTAKYVQNSKDSAINSIIGVITNYLYIHNYKGVLL